MPELPKRRAKDVRIHEVDDEVVIYDGREQIAHRLNPTSARVWDLIDGDRTPEAIAGSLDCDVAVVELAIRQLAEAGLLQTDPGVSRRAALSRLSKVAAVGVILPSIASIPAPLPVAAQSGGSSGISQNNQQKNTPVRRRRRVRNGWSN